MNHLKNKEYSVVVSTDNQIVEIAASTVAENCGKDCKFWNIAHLNPTDGTITIDNQLVGERPEGAALYEYSFQGSNLTAKYCRLNNGRLIYQCANNDTDCAVKFGGTCTNTPETDAYISWSRANY